MKQKIQHIKQNEKSVDLSCYSYDYSLQPTIGDFIKSALQKHYENLWNKSPEKKQQEDAKRKILRELKQNEKWFEEQEKHNKFSLEQLKTSKKQTVDYFQQQQQALEQHKQLFYERLKILWLYQGPASDQAIDDEDIWNSSDEDDLCAEDNIVYTETVNSVQYATALTPCQNQALKEFENMCSLILGDYSD